MKKTSPWLSKHFTYAALVSIGFLIYSNTFHASFHLDDIAVILENPALRNIFDLKALWDAFNTRFVVGLGLALNYRLGGTDVVGYHVFNITVHVFASILVHRFLQTTLRTPGLSGSLPPEHGKILSLFAALVFLAHPIQTQAVTYIWQRAASLATVFYLSSLIFYAIARLSSSRPHYLASLVCAILGMLTKETTITLPFVIALYELCFMGGRGDRPLKRFFGTLPFFLLLPVIPLVMMRAPYLTLEIMRLPVDPLRPDLDLGSITRFATLEEMPRSTYILTQINVLRTYLRLLFLPLNQNLDYDYPLSHRFFEKGTFLSFVLLVSVFLGAVRFHKRHRLVSFGVFWFFLTLSVESIVPQNDVIFEHRLYLPMVGFSLFATYGLYALLSKQHPKTWIIVMTLLTGTYGYLTYQRNFIWKNELTLWSDVIRKSPKNEMAYNNRGNAYQVKGLLDQSLSDFNNAIRIKPNYALAYINRGNVYQSKGLLDQALSDYNRVIQFKPDFAEAYNNRGGVYQAGGLLDQAISDFDKAIQIRPDYANAYSNRGSAYQAKGLLDQAISEFGKAVRIKPDLAEAYYNRGNLYQAKGLLDPAISDYDKAIQIQPDFAKAYNNRGAAYQSKGLLGQAILDYDKAVRLKPDYVEARNNRLNADKTRTL